MYTFPADTSDHNKVLIMLGEIGVFLTKQFNSLRSIEDWEGFYEYLTENFNQERTLDESTWNTDEVRPCNFDDLVWKTKVRFLSMHVVGLADLEGQKRTASFTCSLMGIIPVSSIRQSGTSGESGRIHLRLNKWRSVHPERNGNLGDLLIANQSKTIQMKIGILNTNQEGLGGLVQRFYSEFSVKKADAAAKAQERSWKDITIGLCRDTIVRAQVLPADFSREYLGKVEDKSFGNPKEQKEFDNDSGTILQKWMTTCKRQVLHSIYMQVKSNAVSKVMPRNQPTETFLAFSQVCNRSGIKNTTSIWSFPKSVPLPKPIHTLVYLLCLIGPAAAHSDHTNPGLENFEAVILSKGSGIQVPIQDCFTREDPEYSQTVSPMKVSTCMSLMIFSPYVSILFHFSWISGFIDGFYKPRNSTYSIFHGFRVSLMASINPEIRLTGFLLK
jgi:hypothetical protein